MNFSTSADIIVLSVTEKLEKKNAAFLTAFLGSLANRQKFLESQAVACPDYDN